jgi:hypothetical protein
MKKLFILFSALMIGFQSFAFLPGGIDQKFLRTFDSSFPNAKDVSWVEYPEGYEVYFIQGDMSSRVFYPKDLSFMRLTRYYKEEHLPYQVRFTINNEFPGKKIFGITEVVTVSKADNALSTIYFIIVEDAKKWFTVKLDETGTVIVGKVLKKDF